MKPKPENRNTKLPQSFQELQAAWAIQRQPLDAHDVIVEEDIGESEHAASVTPKQKKLHKTPYNVPKSSRTSASLDTPRRFSRSSSGDVWKKYHQFWKADEAGAGIIAHDNTAKHSIVIIKSFKVHASSEQCRLLWRVAEEKPQNIVRLIEVFSSELAIDLVYETMETSLYHIQAACLREITEIDLAIIGKEVHYQ